MIYFDNAATTRMKPPQVAEAVAAAINDFGGVGRGVHEASLDAGLTVFRCRRALATLLNAPDAKRVVFAANVTEALNVVIGGLLHQGDHAITTAASHNSVLRPLFRKADEEQVDVSILPVSRDASIDYDEYERLFRPNTKLVVVTHSSNLTGDVYDVARMARIAHEHGALICIDTAQTAGAVPIDMARDGLDIVAFTGHKSLYGPQGTGGLALAEGVNIPAFKEGGTGTHSYDRRQPDFYPEHLEAGTLNAHGIAGLLAGVSYLQDKGIDALAAQVRELTRRFEKGALGIEGIRVYGGHGGIGRTGIVALNVADLDSGIVADALGRDYGICVRAGAHCAPLMHKALGTDAQGAVRFSFSSFNTLEEVDAGICALREIARA